jgi:hypothetical protein
MTAREAAEIAPRYADRCGMELENSSTRLTGRERKSFASGPGIVLGILAFLVVGLIAD